jgi:hypothetical protein
MRLADVVRVTAAIALLTFAQLASHRMPGEAQQTPDDFRLFLSDEEGAGSTPAARGRIVGLWFVDVVEPNAPAFAVATSHVHIVLTCVHFCVPGTTRDLAATNRGVVDASRTRSVGRLTIFVDVPVPSDVPWGVYRVAAPNDGHALAISGIASPLPPIHDAFVSLPPSAGTSGIDDHLREIRAQYARRTVQSFGDLAVDCTDPNADSKRRALDTFERRATLRCKKTGRLPPIFDMPPKPIMNVDVGNDPSLVISRIDRPISPLRAWALGGAVASREASDDSFAVVSPLKLSFTMKSFGSHGCTDPHLWLADGWDVRRTLWIHNPTAPRTGAGVRKGMTKIEVAHLLGFPNRFGTVAEILEIDVWQMPGPLPATIRFRNGVVAGYDPPSQPP